MLKTHAKSLSELLGGEAGKLGGLAAEARRREVLSDYLRKHLPADLAPGFLHCNLGADETLIVLAASPEWAARMRFESATFLQLCRQQKVAVTEVKVRVAQG